MENIMSGMFLLKTYPLLCVSYNYFTPAPQNKFLSIQQLGETDFIFISLQDKKSILTIYLLKRRNDFVELLLPGN